MALEGGLKCKTHRKKGSCIVANCLNQAYQKGVCVRHGARSSPCSVPDCFNRVRVGGVCYKHAISLPATKCTHEGCSSLARGAPTCRRHCPDRAATRAQSFYKSTPVVSSSDESGWTDDEETTPLPVSTLCLSWQPAQLEGFEDILCTIDWCVVEEASKPPSPKSVDVDALAYIEDMDITFVEVGFD
ncbi:Aste57867_9377 [Aphanomyces stellatus]|uniref:Aste57867_9377 protein n=1 Tax=Aphanomyces stellatus TaxID=120398 RepID=A0A485KMV6_9STRA|nr:hypothetical protein As57867_009341 [Aphanomyces stellatus]VFT86258.1 Aste57867_9377 [Aphanomyces stellatus]